MATRYKIYTQKHFKYGNGSLAAATDYVDITHTLGATPTSVFITPTTEFADVLYWVDTKGSTTFRFHVTATDASTHTFDWFVGL